VIHHERTHGQPTHPLQTAGLKASGMPGIALGRTTLWAGRFAVGPRGFSHSHQATTRCVKNDSVKVLVHVESGFLKLK
jgi:hypothetical protein